MTLGTGDMVPCKYAQVVELGRHAGFRLRCSQEFEGSIPSPRTMKYETYVERYTTWQAECTCGWFGKANSNEHDATMEERSHRRLHEDEIEREKLYGFA